MLIHFGTNDGYVNFNPPCCSHSVVLSLSIKSKKKKKKKTPMCEQGSKISIPI